MRLWKGILWGILAALGGLVFAANFGEQMNGMPMETMFLAGLMVYLIVVIVTCTYVLYHKNK